MYDRLDELDEDLPCGQPCQYSMISSAGTPTVTPPGLPLLTSTQVELIHKTPKHSPTRMRCPSAPPQFCITPPPGSRLPTVMDIFGWMGYHPDDQVSLQRISTINIYIYIYIYIYIKFIKYTVNYDVYSLKKKMIDFL